jgi:hypothetical protein
MPDWGTPVLPTPPILCLKAMTVITPAVMARACLQILNSENKERTQKIYKEIKPNQKIKKENACQI